MANAIQIFGNFDGGNPQDPKSIIQTSPNAFTIIPYSEDNDPSYKFRLDVNVENNTKETMKLHLSIDWQEIKKHGAGSKGQEIGGQRTPVEFESENAKCLKNHVNPV